MKTIKKLLTILLIAFATVAGAQNNWYAPSVFHEKVSFKKEVSQTDGSDSLTLRTIGTNSTLNHGLGTLLLNNSKSAIGLFNGTGYRVAATATNIQLQQGATDSILINFSGDTAHVNATVNAWKFTPKLDANSVTGFWDTSGNAGTNPATNFLGTTDGQPLIIKSDSAVAANIGDSVFFAMGKKIPYQLAPATYSGFKLVSSDHLGHWAGIYGLNSPTPGNPFNGFTVVGVMDSINEFYSISEYAPGVMEHEIITPGGVNVVSKLTQTTYNLGDYFSSNQYLQFDWEVGTWNLGANQWNNATIYGDTVANTITNICDGGFVVKNHSNTDLALCDSVNITLTDAVHISTNLPRIKFDDVVRLNAYTVGTLPAGTVGDMAYVTDAAAPVYGATLVGGGAVRTIAFFDGTNWTAH